MSCSASRKLLFPPLPPPPPPLLFPGESPDVGRFASLRTVFFLIVTYNLWGVKNGEWGSRGVCEAGDLKGWIVDRCIVSVASAHVKVKAYGQVR